MLFCENLDSALVFFFLKRKGFAFCLLCLNFSRKRKWKELDKGGPGVLQALNLKVLFSPFDPACMHFVFAVKCESKSKGFLSLFQ